MEDNIHLPKSQPSVVLWFPGREQLFQSVEDKGMEMDYKKRLRASEGKN